MLEAEKIALVKAMSGETDESTVSAYLRIAGNKVCRKAYPFDPTVMEVPDCYGYTQVEIAVQLIKTRENDGILSHSENGYSESYDGGERLNTLLKSIVPMVGVVQ